MATRTQPRTSPKHQAKAAAKAQPKIETTSTKVEASPENDKAGEPVCPRHQVAAVVERTDGFFASYRCPEEGCKFTTKRPLPRLREKLDRENAQRQFEAR